MRQAYGRTMRPPACPNQSEARIAERLRAMFGMHEVGVEMLRCRLRREHPHSTPQELSRLVSDYLQANRYDPDVFVTRACSRFSAKS
ncbi:MAG: hypothetical protein ACE37H_08235 [Phycisphaeraceae bacterium]